MDFSFRLLRENAGFTLIELLIVVAIIGILAAIAVPNFLNARLRAMLSRVYAEHRMLEDALTAYHLDANAYPVDNGSGVIRPAARTIEFNGIQQTITGIGVLTTPVAYIPQIPKDPFIPLDNPKTDWIECYVYFGSNAPFPYGTFTGRAYYMFYSIGPDGEWQAGFGDDRYHVTNGLISRGDIIRVGPSLRTSAGD